MKEDIEEASEAGIVAEAMPALAAVFIRDSEPNACREWTVVPWAARARETLLVKEGIKLATECKAHSAKVNSSK